MPPKSRVEVAAAKAQAARAKARASRPDTRARQNRRDILEQVERIVSKWFFDFPSGVQNYTEVAPYGNLRQWVYTLLEELEARGKKKVLARHIMPIRQHFATDSMPEYKLRPLEGDGAIRREVQEALDQAESINTRDRSSSTLSLFLDTARDLNRAELCLLLDACILKCPKSSPQNRAFILEILEVVRRLALQVKFPDEVDALSSKWDLALSCQYNELWKDGITPLDYVGKYGHLIEQVADLKELKAVLNSDKEWSELTPRINELSSKSLVVQKMFAPFEREMHESYVLKIIKVACSKVLTEDGITVESFDRALQWCVDQLAESRSRDILNGPREVEMDFMGFQCSVPVGSVDEMIRLAFANVIKEHAVGWQILFLPHEAHHIFQVKAVKTNIDDVLIEKHVEGRAAWVHVFETRPSTVSCLEDVKEYLKRHKSFWFTKDRTLVVEFACFQRFMVAEGQVHLKKCVFDMLPTAPIGFEELNETYKALKLVQGSMLYVGAPASSQLPVKMIIESVHDVVNMKKPRHHKCFSSGSWVQKAAGTFRFMCSCDTAGEGEPSNVLTGKEALEYLIPMLENQDPSELRGAIIDPMLVFKYLLDHPWQLRLEKAADNYVTAQARKLEDAAAAAAAAAAAGDAEPPTDGGEATAPAGEAAVAGRGTPNAKRVRLGEKVTPVKIERPDELEAPNTGGASSSGTAEKKPVKAPRGKAKAKGTAQAASIFGL